MIYGLTLRNYRYKKPHNSPLLSIQFKTDKFSEKI